MSEKNGESDVADKHAEWAILTLLFIVGLYFIFDTLFLKDQNGTIFIPFAKAVISAVLFAVAAWAAVRTKGVLATLCTLPLLITSVLSFVIPPIDRIEALSRDLEAVSEAVTREAEVRDAGITQLTNRMNRVRLFGPAQFFEARRDKTDETYVIEGSSNRHICYIEGIHFSGSNDHIGRVRLLRPDANNATWRVTIQEGTSDTVNTSISCLELPVE